MGAYLRYLTWYYDKIHRVLGAIYRFSGAIAGLCFVLGVPLGLSVAKRISDVRIPVVPAANEPVFVIFVLVAAVFVVSVFVETFAGIGSFFAGLIKRLLQWIQ